MDLKDPRQRSHPLFLSIAAFFNLLFIAAVALILVFWDHRPLSVLGFGFENHQLVFSLIALLLSPAVALVYVWFLHSRKKLRLTWEKNYFRQGGRGRFIVALVVLFIAALQEEIMFRGYFGFVLLPFGFWPALLISSLIFTLWHFLTNKVNLFQAIDWLLGGIMLFFVYWLSGSVWVAAFVHFSRNFTNVLVFNIADSNAVLRYENPISPRQKTLYTIAHSVIFMLFAYFYF